MNEFELQQDDQWLMVFNLSTLPYSRMFSFSDRLLSSTTRTIFEKINGIPKCESYAQYRPMLRELFQNGRLIIDGQDLTKYELDPRKFRGGKFERIIEINLEIGVDA